MADDAMELLRLALRRVAPEVDLDDVDHDADLLDELDLDSMDFLTLVGELHQRSGVEIPEADYAQMGSVSAVVGYLQSRQG